MYNASTQKYEHVSPYHLVDMSDGTQDNAMDAGLWWLTLLSHKYI